MSEGTQQAQDVRSKVLDALNKGGYALEMRIAARARQGGAGVVGQSRYYTDPVSQKTREIDVVAHWMSPHVGRQSWVHLFMVIECKSKPAPWVIFDDGRPTGETAVHNFDWSVISVLPPKNAVQDSFVNKLRTEVQEYETDSSTRPTLLTPTEYGVGNGIVQVSFGSANEKATDTDKAWAAVQGAVSAARGLRADTETRRTASDSGDQQALVLVWIPVVVTSGLLYRSWLNEGDTVDLEEIERGSVNVRIDTDDTARCIVVTEEGFDKLLIDAGVTVEIFT